MGKPISRVLYLTVIYLRRNITARSCGLPSGQRRAAALCAHFDLAPDGVYTAAMSP